MDLITDYWEIVLRLVLALIAGAILGWEREAQSKPAGLRTHMMVSLGAAVFMIVGLQIMQTPLEEGHNIRYDPLRVVQGILGGVGFLGAGAIIHARGSVRGITTAASIWLTAAIGIACGIGYYLIASTAAVLGLVVLLLFGFLERNVFREDSSEGDEHSSSSDDAGGG